MLKKLRTQFVITAMVLLIIVVGLIVTAINVFNYVSVLSSADDMLRMLADNQGHFPEKPEPDGPGKPNDHGGKGGGIHITPETPYESRFFTVKFDGENLVEVNTSSIAAVDDAMAVKMAERAIQRNKSHRFMSHYRYIISENDGITTVIFLDCTRQLESFTTFLLLSVVTSLSAVLILFILLSITSERIVRPLNESYEKQKQFITNAGHDLKTPLTIIDADAELLEMEVGENEWLSDIRRQTARLATLTSDLVYLARMEEIEHPEYVDFPISEVAEDTLSSFSAPAKTKNVTISASVQPAVYFFGEEEIIRKLITLLLDNAIKYSPEGEVVEFSLKKNMRGVNIRITNIADNLDDEDIERMFDRFYRSDKARSSGGFGIGLSVVNAIVAHHKGRITATKQQRRLVIEVSL